MFRYSPPISGSISTGSILLLTVFVVFAMSTLALCFWKLMSIEIDNLANEKMRIKAEYAARGGIEDAIYELKKNQSWNAATLDPQWHHETDAPATQFYKSTVAADSPLTHFDDPTTISVQVSGDLTVGTVNISCTASVRSLTDSTRFSIQRVTADVIGSVSGRMYVVGEGY